MLVSVIIPYYQNEPHLLRRAVQSVLRQKLDAGIAVDILIVDDESPVSARGELTDIVSDTPFRLKLFEKRNGGAASARNMGLMNLDPATRYVAFLDSDDIWYADHLQTGLMALESGRDFYFCDNRRPGHYESSFGAEGTLMKDYLRRQPVGRDVIDISTPELLEMNIRDFVTHPQGTIFRRDIAPDLMFDISFKNAGEDFVFFTKLVARTARNCFSPRIHVECGRGVNIYYGSFDWETAGFIRRLIDELRARLIVRDHVPLRGRDRQWLNADIAAMRRNVAYHGLRRFWKDGLKWPDELRVCARSDPYFSVWFPFCCVESVVGKACGLYHPR